MLTMKHPCHTALHDDDDALTQQSEPKRFQFEHAVLKAYGIVAVHECFSSFKAKSVPDVSPSQSRGKESGSPFILRKKAASFTSKKDFSVNDILTQTPFAAGQPWQIARASAEVRTKKYEEDVLKAYGVISLMKSKREPID